MEKQYFIQLLHKYFKSGLTKEECDYVESYYNLFQDEPDILDTLDANEKNEFKNEIKGVVWDKIVNLESPHHTIRLNHRRNGWMAAAGVILILLTVGIFFRHDGPVKKTSEKMVMIKHLQNRLIFLPDGSKVLLNSDSRLNYPSSFDGKKSREVYLQGQAFFDIQHDANKPFIVHTGKLETIVLGTAFNIKAMPGDKEITVSVVRGKVKVSDQKKVLGIITPNQEIKYDKEQNNSRDNSMVQVIADRHFLDWKNEDMLFNNITVAEALKVLEQEYHVTIAINDPSVSSQRFTATFSRHGSLEQALKSICEFNGVTYQYNKNNATVSILNNLKIN